MLNLHPKFYIFCESTLNRVFLNVNNDFGRIVSYSTRTRRDVSKIVDYCTKGYMSYKDFYLMMSVSNKKIVENGWIIGDKNPMMISEYISFIKWALSEPRFFFPCIIKDDLSLIIKSFYKEAIRRDIYNNDENELCNHLIQHTGRLIGYVSGLNNLLNENEAFKLRSFFYKFSDFVVKPEPYLNYIFEKLYPDDDFIIEKYNLQTYGNRITNILDDRRYGYKNHVTTKKGLMDHQKGLLKEIRMESTANDINIDKLLSRMKNESYIFEKWDEIMENFYFLSF